MAKVGLITVHGMGETKRGYADKFFEELEDRMGTEAWSDVISHTVYYQDIIQHNQERYLARVKDRVDWHGLRKFMLYGFSDASSLESYKKGDRSPYYLSQQAILSSFRQIYQTVDASIPVVIVAQSLGGQVITNYLWDAADNDPTVGIWASPPDLTKKEEAFCRGKSVARLFTTGCNIPLFLAGRDQDRITPIDPTNYHQDFQWHNYYDEDDVLGWPLRDLSPEYSRLVQDIRMNSGGLIMGATPFSHTKYWTDRDFLKPLAETLRQYSGR